MAFGMASSGYGGLGAAGVGATPFQIGGALPFGAGAGNIDFTGNPASLAANYASAYGAALDMNRTNYANILGGFQNLLGNLVPQQQGIAAGYGQLGTDVLAGIDTIGGAAKQGIADQYTAASGAAAQQLINRGLGNTTVQQSVQRGIEADKSKADVNLADTLAQTKAGYQSQLGLAQLAYRNQAAQQAAAAQQAQLAFMERVSAQYPNAALYGQLAQLFGQQQGQGGRAGGFGMVTQPPGSMGYVPAGGSLPGPTPGSFGGGGGLSVMPSGYGYNPALAAPPPTISRPDIAGYGVGQTGGYTGYSTGPSPQNAFSPTPGANYGVGGVDYSAAGQYAPTPDTYGLYAEDYEFGL